MSGLTPPNTTSAQCPQSTSLPNALNPSTAVSPTPRRPPFSGQSAGPESRQLHTGQPPTLPFSKSRPVFGKSSLFGKPPAEFSMFMRGEKLGGASSHDSEPGLKPLWGTDGLFRDRSGEFSGITCPKAREFIKSVYKMTTVEVARVVGDAIEQFMLGKKPKHEMLETVGRMLCQYSFPGGRRSEMMAGWWQDTNYFGEAGTVMDIIDALYTLRGEFEEMEEKKARLKKWEGRAKEGRGFRATFGHNDEKTAVAPNNGVQPTSPDLVKEASHTIKKIAQEKLEKENLGANTDNGPEKDVWTGLIGGVATTADNKVNDTFKKMRPGINPYWGHALKAVNDTTTSPSSSSFTYPRDVYNVPTKPGTSSSMDSLRSVGKRIVASDSEDSEDENHRPSRPELDPQLAETLEPKSIYDYYTHTSKDINENGSGRTAGETATSTEVPQDHDIANNIEMTGKSSEKEAKVAVGNEQSCDKLPDYDNIEAEKNRVNHNMDDESLMKQPRDGRFAQLQDERDPAVTKTDSVDVDKDGQATQKNTRNVGEETETKDTSAVSTQNAVVDTGEAAEDEAYASTIEDKTVEDIDHDDFTDDHVPGMINLSDREILEQYHTQDSMSETHEGCSEKDEASGLVNGSEKPATSKDVNRDEEEVHELVELDNKVIETATKENTVQEDKVEKKVIEEKAIEEKAIEEKAIEEKIIAEMAIEEKIDDEKVDGENLDAQKVNETAASPFPEVITARDAALKVTDIDKQATAPEMTRHEKGNVDQEVIVISDTPTATASEVSLTATTAATAGLAVTESATSTTKPTPKNPTKSKKPVSSKSAKHGTPPNITPASVIAGKIKMHNASKKKVTPLTDEERAARRKKMEAALDPENFGSSVIPSALKHRTVKAAKGAKKASKASSTSANTQDGESITLRPDLREAANAAREKEAEVVPTALAGKKRRVSQLVDEGTENKTPVQRKMAKRKSTSPANEVAEFEAHVPRRSNRINSGTPSDKEKEKQPGPDKKAEKSPLPPRRSPRNSRDGTNLTQNTALTEKSEVVEIKAAERVKKSPPRRSPRKSAVTTAPPQATDDTIVTKNATGGEADAAPKVTWRARRPKMNLRKRKVVDSDEVEPVVEEGPKRRRRV